MAVTMHFLKSLDPVCDVEGVWVGAWNKISGGGKKN